MLCGAAFGVREGMPPIYKGGKLKTFKLIRSVDVSGISGTGPVAEGCVLSDGEAVLHWFGEHGSVSIYKNVEAITFVHGHNGLSQVVFDE